MCRHAVVHGLGVVVPVVDDDLGLLAVIEQHLANVLAAERSEVVVPGGLDDGLDGLVAGSAAEDGRHGVSVLLQCNCLVLFRNRCPRTSICWLMRWLAPKKFRLLPELA